mmetsp:Transcript_49649/g.142002  ORF Transcript_49649/g.142002 Transcript_49649/m.142002 type:complete len:202 (+) Transcript_49649:683-1288(+)
MITPSRQRVATWPQQGDGRSPSASTRRQIAATGMPSGVEGLRPGLLASEQERETCGASRLYESDTCCISWSESCRLIETCLLPGRLTEVRFDVSRTVKQAGSPKPKSSSSSKPSSIQQIQASSRRPSRDWHVWPPWMKKLLPESSQLAKWLRGAGAAELALSRPTSRHRQWMLSDDAATCSNSHRSPSATSLSLSALRLPP